MDSEDYRSLLSAPRSVAHRPNVPHIQITTSTPMNEASLQQFQLHSHNQQESSLLLAPSMNVYPVVPLQNDFSVQEGQAPTIRILPATPSESQNPHRQDIHSSGLSSDQSSPMSPMSITPANSPAANRKSRFTMGPRSDCEMCRQGVKGHWMHFD